MHILEVVMNVKSHSISVHITQPYGTVTTWSPNIPYPALPCHSITDKHTVSLHANTLISHRHQWPHTITAHMDRRICHTQRYQHTISISHITSTQVYAQKCSDPDVVLRAAYTQKTQFLMEPCTQSGDSRPVVKSHSNTSSPACT